MRIVLDSAAEFQGKSLNKALLTGPALQKKLPSVMLKFRQREVAICADISTMFSRIRLKPEDARHHRFLWSEKGKSEILTFQIDRLTFGDASSPFIANLTLRRTADDHGKGHQRVVEAIYENFYVDDYLDSTDTPGQAIDLGRQVKAILERGGFHLCKWLSNSAIVRDEFGDKTGSETNFTTDWETKVLGVK